MRHARDEALDTLADLLEALRAYNVLQERTPGSFYYKHSGFLHFHEDPAGLFADLKLDGRHFERFEVTTDAQRQHLLTLVATTLTPASSPANNRPEPFAREHL